MSLDESYFPIVWTKDGRRSAWLGELPAPTLGVGPPA